MARKKSKWDVQNGEIYFDETMCENGLTKGENARRAVEALENITGGRLRERFKDVNMLDVILTPIDLPSDVRERIAIAAKEAAADIEKRYPRRKRKTPEQNQ